MCFYRYAYSWEALCTYFYLVFLQLGSILHVFFICIPIAAKEVACIFYQLFTHGMSPLCAIEQLTD